MVLGQRIIDDRAIEGATNGLGLFPLHTEIDPTKLTRQAVITFQTMDLP